MVGGWWRWQMRRVATSEQCSVTLADLWHDHTPGDLLDYVEMLDWGEEQALREGDE